MRLVLRQVGDIDDVRCVTNDTIGEQRLHRT
ncbi:MAG: hypothetical protein QOI75_1755, partial [Pseudonocardiales bacterium]|nr:hypothetical protein [Pseudonocardiales bacterium]